MRLGGISPVFGSLIPIRFELRARPGQKLSKTNIEDAEMEAFDNLFEALNRRRGRSGADLLYTLFSLTGEIPYTLLNRLRRGYFTATREALTGLDTDYAVTPSAVPVLPDDGEQFYLVTGKTAQAFLKKYKVPPHRLSDQSEATRSRLEAQLIQAAGNAQKPLVVSSEVFERQRYFTDSENPPPSKTDQELAITLGPVTALPCDIRLDTQA